MMLRILLSLFLLIPTAVYAKTPVDVELVLAVDTSNSVTPPELQVQRKGYAEALESAEFLAAIQTGQHQAVAVLYYEWGGSGNIANDLGWHYITDIISARKLAEKIHALTDLGAGGATFMSNGVRYGFNSIRHNDFEGSRRVIDVSADGRNDGDESMPEIQDYAHELDITINGLAVMLEWKPNIRQTFPPGQNGPADKNLDKYMDECVRYGIYSFVEKVIQTQDFPVVIKRKMTRETLMSNLRTWYEIRYPYQIIPANNVLPNGRISLCEPKNRISGGH